MNALAGYQRAIVSAIPGTTRDVVTISTAIDGWPVQLSDTAGIRETQDELERAGIGLATSTLSRADLGILVHDVERLNDGRPADNTMLDPSVLAPQAQVIHVLNKVDVVPAADRPQLVQQVVDSHATHNEPLLLSALTGEGIPALISAIGHALVPRQLAAGSAVPFTTDQFAALGTVKSAIERRNTAAATAALHAMLTETRG
jgi:tRNA modification GTPase